MKTMEIVNTWNAMSDAEKVSIVRNCVFKAIRNGRKIKSADIEDAMQDTFVAVLKRISREEEESESLSVLVMRCANATLERKRYRAKKDACIIDNITVCENGEQFDILDTVSSNVNTEHSTITRIAIQSLQEQQDDIGKKILELLVQGFTEREIAASVGISNVAVHKRIVKMRSALKELFA